jgi:hypothetical protein
MFSRCGKPEGGLAGIAHADAQDDQLPALPVRFQLRFAAIKVGQRAALALVVNTEVDAVFLFAPEVN